MAINTLPCGLKVNTKLNECCKNNCPHHKIRENEYLIIDECTEGHAIDLCYDWYKNGQKGEDPVKELR